MYLISEKSLLHTRFISCLIAISMLLLMLSSFSLFQFSDNSYVNVIYVNSTSVYLEKPSVKNRVKYPIFRSRTLPKEDLRIDQESLASRVVSGGMGNNNRWQTCNPLLKVYMYDLPREFHFGLLNWKGRGDQKWPDVTEPKRIPSYPGGLNAQHSIEYWLTLDLLSSEGVNVIRPCTAIRVHNSSEANIIFVPFFSSLSYNRYSKIRGKEKVSVNRVLQDRLVEFLKGRDEWKRSGGKDHLIVAHHPNSMLIARRKLGSAMFVLADFGRYPVEIANLEKDVIAPYKHMVKTIVASDSPLFDERPILVYFQGAIYRKDGGVIRQELYYLLKDEIDVHFAFGSIRSNGVNRASRGMSSSKFCLNIAGDTPSSNRLFDAIASQCVPVIISDEIELPFEDVLDYSEFCIFVRASDAVREGYLVNLLRGVGREKWTKMWERLKGLSKHFEYQFPSRPSDAVDMIWQAIARKRSFGSLNVHRKNRYRRSQLFYNADSSL